MTKSTELTESEKSRIVARIASLQNSRDYAAPELEPQITAEIERLQAQLDEPIFAAIRAQQPGFWL